ANTDNILKDATPGSDVVLTIDVAMQKQLEDLLKAGLERAKSGQGSAIIMDPDTGAIKAMANWPTYDPSNYGDVEDANTFNNASVSHPIEVGSVMKPLTMAAALDQGAVQTNTTYYDPAKFKIDDFTITNIEEDGGPGTKSMADLLNLSLNTGATWLLMRMSGNGDHITKEGRDKWYEYMANHFMFGKPTGIEQTFDAEGAVPDPDKGYARDLTYANTSFGQAMTATPLQMAAAYSAVLNGGTYYKPRLVDSYISPEGKVTNKKPEVVRTDVVSQTVSDELQPLLEYVVDKHSFSRKFDQSTYSVGGKTGTAQIADHDNGGYLADEFNGTYLGFVGGDKPQYVIAVSVIKPKIKGYAGSQAAQPIFGDIAHMLIDKFNVTPKVK
ncbi:MAG TPA: penicillin-binding protein 2, partial [Candidatus Saccharimonadales bacterium]|nr:penicillin-binding protein 2 [Candidatus Saccharimonadales bacterium]